MRIMKTIATTEGKHPIHSPMTFGTKALMLLASYGPYWVVVYPEHSAAHEAFWSHFYLTDDFEYQTIFDKSWRKRLPARWRDPK